MKLSFEHGPSTSERNVRRFLYRAVGYPVDGHDLPVAEQIPIGDGELADGDIAERESRAFAAGLAQGKAQAEANVETKIRESRKAVATAIRLLGKQRRSYFRELESEVVALAMAIAKKVLHREAQIDRLVLAGVVRVALDRVAGVASVDLRVHVSEADGWRDLFSQDRNLSRVVEVTADPLVAPGSCVLSSDLGSTTLSLEGQLKEIEEGFVDLLNRKSE